MDRPTITLLTDFGYVDSYVAQMKGVILGIAPTCNLVDVTHGIAPQQIRAGAFALRQVVDTFAAGTIHVAVVDPGVGTARGILAARIAGQIFVLPDNGLLTYVLDDFDIAQCVFVQNQAYLRQPVSATFHGRDIMAPVAAHVASGTELAELGPPCAAPARLPELGMQRFEQQPSPIEPSPIEISPVESSPIESVAIESSAIEVIAIDHFGNVVTSLRRTEATTDWPEFATVGSRKIRVVRTFGDARPGELIALVGSHGHLEFAVVEGSAATVLKARVGMRLPWTWAC